MSVPVKEKRFNLPSSSTRPRPWTALLCLGGCYGLFGWQCSAFNALWNMGSWVFALGLTFALIWGWKVISRTILMGPKILVSIAVLSMTLTMAVSFSQLFILTIMVVASTVFARLELQSFGFNRFWTLILISIVSGGMIGFGWYVGQYWYSTSSFELMSSLSSWAS